MSFEIALSPRQERALAIALALIPAALALILVAGLVLSWFSHHERMSALLRREAAYRHQLSEQPALQAAVEKTRAANASQNYFFADRQASDAAGRMRAQIRAIVTSDGGTVQRDDVVLAAAGDGSPTELHATLSFSGDIKTLTKVLYHLGQAKPLFFATQLAVHATPSAAAPLTAPNRLQTDLTVEAYLSPS